MIDAANRERPVPTKTPRRSYSARVALRRQKEGTRGNQYKSKITLVRRALTYQATPSRSRESHSHFAMPPRTLRPYNGHVISHSFQGTYDLRHQGTEIDTDGPSVLRGSNPVHPAI
jgi:hypothetical protein